MAVFQSAYKKTAIVEGGYCNDPDDSGGETYKGISRNNFPAWEGWGIVDRTKDLNPESLNIALGDNAGLDALVLSFYKKRFWDVYSLDACDSQIVAEEIYDSGVNIGSGVISKWVQRVLNALNYDLSPDGPRWEEIVVDGKVGSKTIEVMNKALKFSTKMETRIVKLLDGLQRVHYLEICEAKKTREKFLTGWIDLRTR